MAFIRNRNQELTGYQESAPYHDKIDLGCDFVMVYGVNDTLEERIKKYREKGYVVHLMTGIAWGDYQDYLYAKWDGRDHWDEAQVDRHGNRIQHGHDIPYMVPTVSFADYISEKMQPAIDAGVEAIHLEEPEFWDHAGYSEAFKREYLLHYREEWVDPNVSLDARYKAARLKAWLYTRTLARVSASLKEYAYIKYGKILRVYVPTHSLLNYTQWKIMSPEGALIDIPSLDGYIAQVWTGTSRSENVFEGVYRERTFETAYLEYGVMQELVRGTGRDMWFLHDPIEDNPDYDWDDYRTNYLKTVVASLLHPAIHTYEICPWPNRVYRREYPIDRATNKPREGAEFIPKDYASLLNGLIQTFGDMEQPEIEFEGGSDVLGVFMSDTGLYQRTFPDGYHPRIPENASLTNTAATTDGQREFFAKVGDNPEHMLAFIASGTFPQFFGLTLPLLKYGLPVRPILLDNLRRFPGYLSAYKRIVLSYEFIKPESPDVNNVVAEWVRSGGTLFYVGDGSDPYHTVDSWWKNGGYDNPAQHLFEMLGLDRDLKDGTYKVGKGVFVLKTATPATFCLSPALASDYREWIKAQLTAEGTKWEYTNRLVLRRGPYTIAVVMDESLSDEPLTLKGTYVDVFTPGFDIITEKIVKPGENALLYDLSVCKEDAHIIGTSARIFEMDEVSGKRRIKCRAAADVVARIRIFYKNPISAATAVDSEGNKVDVKVEFDTSTSTALYTFVGNALDIVITEA